jgi:hypothetical protein
MPALTQRRDPDRIDCWHVHYGDVRVGTISRRFGNSVYVASWQWPCGFYPGLDPASIAVGAVQHGGR